MNLRIGQGYDVHRLAEGEQLWLGGVRIPNKKGTVAHSDGDVLIHAICDALLGAVKLGDIGTHFPDTAPEYKGMDSKVILERTSWLVRKEGYSLVNLDATVCLQEPKLKSYIRQMETVMAGILETDPGRVSVKATTTEKLGFEGREEGVSALAVVLLKGEDE